MRTCCTRPTHVVDACRRRGPTPRCRARPLVRTVAELERITLLLAIFDHDAASSDDELGAVRVPLGFYAAAAAGHVTHRHGPDSYDIEVRAAPIVLGNAHAHTGTLTVTLHVSGGDALRPALAKAAHDGAGSRATTAEAVSWPYREKPKTALRFACGKKKSAPAGRRTRRCSRRAGATRSTTRRWRRPAFPVTAAANAATARRKSKEAQEIAARRGAVAAVNGGAAGSNGLRDDHDGAVAAVGGESERLSSMTDTVDVAAARLAERHTRVLVDGRLVASGDGGGVYEFEAAGWSCAWARGRASRASRGSGWRGSGSTRRACERPGSTCVRVRENRPRRRYVPLTRGAGE